MTYSTTITSKGQITLPAQLRAKLKLLPGKKVTVHLKGTSLVVNSPIDIDLLRKKNARFLVQHNVVPITDEQIDTSWTKAAIKRNTGKK